MKHEKANSLQDRSIFGQGWSILKLFLKQFDKKRIETPIKNVLNNLKVTE